MGVPLTIECCPRRAVLPAATLEGRILLPPAVAPPPVPVRAEAAVAVEPEGETGPLEEAVSAPIYCQRAGDRYYVIVRCGRRPELVGIHTIRSWDLLLERLPGRNLVGSGAYPCKRFDTFVGARVFWESRCQSVPIVHQY